MEWGENSDFEVLRKWTTTHNARGEAQKAVAAHEIKVTTASWGWGIGDQGQCKDEGSFEEVHCMSGCGCNGEE